MIFGVVEFFFFVFYVGNLEWVLRCFYFNMIFILLVFFVEINLLLNFKLLLLLLILFFRDLL